jgi:hypothetical protein
MEFNAPYYDRSLTYSIAAFYDHSLQSIMAVFIAKTPQLGTELTSKSLSDRQDYFFYRFHQFADNYVNMSLDDGIYFSSTAKEKAGTQGGGVRSGKFFIDRQKTEKTIHVGKIKYFEQKFKSCISGDRDERLFLGVNQIWNRIAIERGELLAPYMDAIASAYDDDSFSTPIPDRLNRYLVPLKLRNKTVQKWSNRRRIVPVCKEQEVSEEKKEDKKWRIEPVLLDDEEW